MADKQNLPDLLDKFSFWLFILAILLLIIYLAMPFILLTLEQHGIIKIPQPSVGSQEVKITFAENATEENIESLANWFSARDARHTLSIPDKRIFGYQLGCYDNMTEVLDYVKNQDGVLNASQNTGSRLYDPPLCNGHSTIIEPLILLLLFSAVILRGVGWLFRKKARAM